MVCSYSHLDENDLKAIQALESEIGKSLLSFSCHNVKMADVDSNTLEKIQKLEKKLSVSLVAVEA